MKCSNCGRNIPNDSNYCEYCGVQVLKKTKPSYGKYWLIAILIFILPFYFFPFVSSEGSMPNSFLNTSRKCAI